MEDGLDAPQVRAGLQHMAYVELAALLAGVDAHQPGAGECTLHASPCSFILQPNHLL